MMPPDGDEQASLPEGVHASEHSPQGADDPSTRKESRKKVGSSGEEVAAPFIEERGYRIIDSNVRPIGGRRRGEIDIVAWHEEYLVFVEVKTRRLRIGSACSPAEAVDRRKRRQLVHLARAYIARYRLEDVPCRFDVVEVIRQGESLMYNLILNAFDADDI